ncbi:MAG: potassium-transporting ATPase subunit KdpC [Elusimicrobia bacterium]|nr:potassium-transporting ATPase subunit KdpC [Elusimicrobiota bacterium]
MKTFWPAVKIFLVLTFITGLAYPLVVTGFARVFFSGKAGGSFVGGGGKTAGSELIGQEFKAPRYFWGRPSAIGYNPLPSGGGNLSPVSLALQKQAADNTLAFLAANPEAAGKPVPPEMVFASGSGVDPHISSEAARIQCARVAKARGVPEIDIISLVDALTEQRQVGFLGELRVNVLRLNLELDEKYLK